MVNIATIIMSNGNVLLFKIFENEENYDVT